VIFAIKTKLVDYWGWLMVCCGFVFGEFLKRKLEGVNKGTHIGLM
tara:strand:- start:915 stop:1049 length:135 start_codon:yes stop_codon:yes gene_type:complete